MFNTISLLWASLRARPQFYLELKSRSRKQVRDDRQDDERDDGHSVVTLHRLERRAHCYAVVNTHTAEVQT
ncbi:MAG: hypothetical protein PVJ92_03605, partial [Candidatus Dependentiae bacterium]